MRDQILVRKPPMPPRESVRLNYAPRFPLRAMPLGQPTSRTFGLGVTGRVLGGNPPPAAVIVAGLVATTLGTLGAIASFSSIGGGNRVITNIGLVAAGLTTGFAALDGLISTVQGIGMLGRPPQQPMQEGEAIPEGQAIV